MRCQHGPDYVDRLRAARDLLMISSRDARILVATVPVDFRKSHDGLAAVAQNVLGMDPFSGVAYVFRSWYGDRIKVS